MFSYSILKTSFYNMCQLWAIKLTFLLINNGSGSEKYPGGGHGNPLQYSCLENPMTRGAWWDRVHRVAKNQTQLEWLSTHCTCMCLYHWDKTTRNSYRNVRKYSSFYFNHLATVCFRYHFISEKLLPWPLSFYSVFSWCGYSGVRKYLPIFSRYQQQQHQARSKCCWEPTHKTLPLKRPWGEKPDGQGESGFQGFSKKSAHETLPLTRP